MKQKQCITCSKVFLKRLNEAGVEWASRKYCSHLCANRSTRTDMVRQKISDTCKKSGIGTWMSGRKRPLETTLKQREKMVVLVKAGTHNFWKGGVSEMNRTKRANFQSTFAYKAFRKAVLERDNYTCQACDKRGGWLEVDHIKSYALYPELRTEVANGRTLCRPCHLKTPNFGHKALIYT